MKVGEVCCAPFVEPFCPKVVHSSVSIPLHCHNGLKGERVVPHNLLNIVEDEVISW